MTEMLSKEIQRLQVLHAWATGAAETEIEQAIKALREAIVAVTRLEVREMRVGR